MMQNQYCHMMDQTAPGEDLIQAALQQSTAARRCRRRKRPRLAAAVRLFRRMWFRYCVRALL